MASVLDPPLVSVWAASILVASVPLNPTIKEVLPSTAALPLLSIAIWCVWAAHCAPEVSSDSESVPVPPEVAVLVAELPKGAADTTIESPEVVAYAALSPEVAAEAAEPHKTGTSVLAPCTVVAPNHSHLASVLMPGLELATEAVYELSPCPVPAMFGLSTPPVTATKATNELSASLLVALSASSVPVLPRSQSMTRVPAPPWRAPAPPAPPWRAPAPPASPWWAPALPAPLWWAPALPGSCSADSASVSRSSTWTWPSNPRPRSNTCGQSGALYKPRTSPLLLTEY
ncbi:Protein FAM71E2 [Labeo rohita]|uniref:Protein FAM71E2 n=1 Tax=Labeo rohita TaxID=84645 RepID=A0ABQ8LY95_LABRO|nr:Protein FAM71E2 [Labeo rohita]